MKITPDVFEAYLKCPTKCWLRSTGEPSAGATYPEWVKAQNDSYRKTGTERLLTDSPKDEVVFSPDMDNVKGAKWQFASGLAVQAQMDFYVLESELHAVERVSSEGGGQDAQFIPIRFTFTNKLYWDDKLLLAFDALVLSEMLCCDVSSGNIVHGDDHATRKVQTAALAGKVRKIIGKIAKLLASHSPPDLVLNRHCVECEFRDRCRQKSIEQDDLSLLSNMTEKERRKFNSKCIFTVKQLSYTFRARRRPKRLAGKREKYHHSLKALAIRERKIHIVEPGRWPISGRERSKADSTYKPTQNNHSLATGYAQSGESANRSDDSRLIRASYVDFGTTDFLSAIKLIAFRAENMVIRILLEHVPDHERADSILRDIFKGPADLVPNFEQKTLIVLLHPRAVRRHNEALRHLYTELTATGTLFPGTDLRLIYDMTGAA